VILKNAFLRSRSDMFIFTFSVAKLMVVPIVIKVFYSPYFILRENLVEENGISVVIECFVVKNTSNCRVPPHKKNMTSLILCDIYISQYLPFN
jgi:hypothetical protein